MFEPSPSSFCISPIRDLDDAAQHGIVSPIPFEGISPEGAVGGMAQPKFVDSPGFSPIRPPKTPIRKIMRRSQEESYLQGMRRDVRKSVFWVSNQIRHKLGCTVTEEDKMFEISELRRTEIKRAISYVKTKALTSCYLQLLHI